MENKIIIRQKKFYTVFSKLLIGVLSISLLSILISLFLAIPTGYKITGIIGIIVIVCILYFIYYYSFLKISIDQKSLFFNNQEILLKNISFTQTDAFFIINKKRLPIMLYEMDDLNTLVHILEEHGIDIHIREDHSFMADNKVMTGILVSFAIIDWFYILTVYTMLYKYLIVCGILTFIPVLFVLYYYFRCLLKGHFDTLIKQRTNIFMTLFLPVIAGWIAIYKNYSLDQIKPIMYLSAAIIIVSYLIYYMINRLLSTTKDMLIICFIVAFLPLSFIWANDTLPAVKRQSQDYTLVFKSGMSSRFGNTYQFTVKMDNKKKVINVSKKVYDSYKNKDTISVTTTTGVFGMESLEVKEKK